MTRISRLLGCEQGMETVEWAVLIALIVVSVVAVISALGTHVNSAFNALSNAAAQGGS